MPVVTCFANMKGGVGKTTLCVNLAFEAFLSGSRVLVVDNDPQFNATSAFLSPADYIESIIKDSDSRTVYDVYEKPPQIHGRQVTPRNLQNCISNRWYFINNPKHRLDIVPSRIELYETLRNPSQKEYLLDKFLRTYASDYDHIFIDCPPTPSVLTLAAFAASDFVLIPVAPDFFATLGLPQFLSTLDGFKSDLHDEHDVSALGVIFTNVPRQPNADVYKSMARVRVTIDNLSIDLPVFDSKRTNLSVYEKSLWQSRPVHKISGTGLRGKGAAMVECKKIWTEVQRRLLEREEDDAED